MTELKENNPLTGKKLLSKLKKLEHLSKEEKAKACGYYTVSEKGKERVNMMQFLNALLEAEGIELDGTSASSASNGRSGRTPSYHTSIQGNGNILIGSVYTKQLGLEPGDDFEIKLSSKHIRLIKVDSSSAAT